MLSIDEIKRKLEDRNLSAVARKVGITRAYLGMIMKGQRKPSYDVLEKLSKYLEE